LRALDMSPDKQQAEANNMELWKKQI